MQFMNISTVFMYIHKHNINMWGNTFLVLINFPHFQVLFVFSLVFFRKIAWQDWPASGVLPTTLSSHLPPSFLYYANLKHIAMHWIAAEKDLTIL